VPMIISIYITVEIFLLLGVREPAANRSLIAFGGCAKSCACWNNGCAGIPECDRAKHSREWLCSRSSVECWSRWLPRSNQSRKRLWWRKTLASRDTNQISRIYAASECCQAVLNARNAYSASSKASFSSALPSALA
jgi:hypothetical protein